ncbi:hypothetical protein [Mucilaginibacter flavus]|uniref:hypothetical protein n=1 Tax=Mucilaginibacter flavus TaxID=931504 RepID=UPI0025B55043|nr:hypothetical protein [Mucilaginibacter flavus]MDN3582091.1 hypothetical protein [Mucilaginibacter flavus]
MKHRIAYFAALSLLLWGCYKESQPAATDIIVNLYSSTLTWPADGATQVPITADLPGKTTAGNYNLIFTTTKGLFYDSQKSTTTITSQRPVPDSAYRAATALLVAPADTGQALVTVNAQDIGRSIKIHFVQALPQTVKISTSSQFVTNAVNSEATITLALQRVPGIPTAGQNVQVTATDQNGNPIGNFRNGALSPSDKNGNATFYFSANQSTYLGVVKIKAALAANTKLADSILVNIVKGN